jgi:RimJ/RimL family protein N-acetyltransferase
MVCERLRLDHASELAVLLRDPRVARTTWSGPEPPTAADVMAGVERMVEHWGSHGFGLWLLRDRATGEMVGRGGLEHTIVEGSDEIEVAWAIVPERWGEGLATELALASIELAFEELALEEIIALTLTHNARSRRVMDKTGFVYERDVEHAGLPHVLYRRRKPVNLGSLGVEREI